MRGLRVFVLLGLAGLSLAMAWQRDPRIDARLHGRAREAVNAILDSAAREGLKVEPLVDLALEGVAKGASEARLVAAVHRHLVLMRRARVALGPESSADEVAAAALALRYGVDIKHLERLREARNGRRIAALNSLVYLVGRGVPPDTAGRALVSVLLAGASDAQIMAMQADIERDIAGGTPAASAAAARALGLEQAIASAGTSGVVPGAALPSARGAVRPGEAAAGGPVGPTATGNAGAADGPRPPAGPRGKPPKRP
jgi:hypothetical protein